MTLVQNLTALRRNWLNQCIGDTKYAYIQKTNIVLHIGHKCEHTFTFNDIASTGYAFRDDKNIFMILMSENSSTNKGNETETYYYNINSNDMEYECKDVTTFLAELENNNITINRIPDALQLSNNLKNKKTVLRPIFLGWHIADKQLELEEEECIRLHNTNAN